MAFLRALNGTEQGKLYRLDRANSILGRHPDCDIVLDEGAVSRQHAQISSASNEFFVEDLGSRNGTTVNGQPVRGRRRLYNNDQVKICDLLFSFQEGEPGQPPRDPWGGPVTLFEDPSGSSTSTIMSTLEIKSSRAGLRVSAVNPEMKLEALLEISRNLGSAISLDQVLPKILDSLFKIFLQADRGFLVLQGPDPTILVPKAMKLRRGDAEDTIRISRTIVRKAMDGKEAILSADAASDARFDSSQSIADFRIRSMMCAPLLSSEGNAMGVIQIDTLDQRTPFSQADLDLLASVASQAAFAVENAQLHEAALRQKALERDLELAHTVQQGFLPHKSPAIASYEFFDFYEPANQVGGDYFDYIVLPHNRLAILVADVSGKGMPAALLMAKLSAEAKYALVSEVGPGGALFRLNAQFAQASWADRFVTMAVLVLDLERHEVQIANAGHLPPYLRRQNGTVEPVGVDQISVPLGVIDELECEQVSVSLAPGDSLVLFTDGISEAMNMNNDLYGLARISQQVALPTDGVKQLGEQILKDVKLFVGKRSQSDDMCLLCLGRTQ
ncbi:MAG TPA: SpoIIE family protein phosphatase [Pirellulales bacterium]|nr:SpoIIE family protein phosphatase [Pirellulales bacterium]